MKNKRRNQLPKYKRKLFKNSLEKLQETILSFKIPLSAY